MKILLHICCAPCSIYPVDFLRKNGYEVEGLFYNPNIHPFREYERRAETLLNYAREINLPVLWENKYGMEKFLRQVVNYEGERCRICYEERMKKAAGVARGKNYAGFTTTLLFSKYQNHELLRSIGREISNREGIPFIYFDFRAGWTYGREETKKLGLYSQSYCGCIFSEKERYFREKKFKERFSPTFEEIE